MSVVAMADCQLPCVHLLIVGDPAIGKTVKWHITGKFLKEYEPTVDATSDYQFALSATSGEKISGLICRVSDPTKLLDSSTANSDHSKQQAAIIMFDETASATYQKWYDEIGRVYGPNIPIVLCGNKVDVKYTFHPEDVEYFELSGKNNHNLEEPVLHLAEKLTGITGLQFVKPLPDAGEDADGCCRSVKPFLDSLGNWCFHFASVVNVVGGILKICWEFIIGCAQMEAMQHSDIP